MPFYDPRDNRPLKLPMIFPGSPAVTQQQAAAIVASWFGSKAGWRGQQFPVYFSSQFATLQEGNEMYGYLNSFQVFLEAAGMFCAPWLVNRIGAKNGLIFAGMVMAMRMVASGLVEGPLLISITKLLHAVELPILLVAIFKYNSLNFDKRLSSTLYLVGFACTSSIIASVLSPLAGYSYEKYGFAQSYLIMGLLVFCTTFISIFLLRSGKSSADPLVSQPTAI